jgi:hypothetical protein
MKTNSKSSPVPSKPRYLHRLVRPALVPPSEANESETEIIRIVTEEGSISIEQAFWALPLLTVDNTRRFLGGMVRRGTLLRLRPGLFALGPNNALSHATKEVGNG